jgi:hypothetical protein
MSPEHDAKEDVKEQARSFAEQQKKAGAEKIGGVAGAIHGAAHELEKQLPQAAAYVHDAAGKLEHAASSLDTQSIDDLLRNVRSFAREQPAAFFGSAVLAGFAISRFLKSTRDSRQG